MAIYNNDIDPNVTAWEQDNNGINTFDLLNEFDLNNLDAYEASTYYDLISKMSKEDALQIIINNVEGDYTQLSHELALIAELMDTE